MNVTYRSPHYCLLVVIDTDNYDNNIVYCRFTCNFTDQSVWFPIYQTNVHDDEIRYHSSVQFV